MSQNLIIPGADNKVRFVFGGLDLTLATDLKITFGSEVYTLLLDPTIVFIESSTTLALDLNATAEVGKIFATIKYFDGGSTLGEDITSRELGNSDQIIVAIGTQLVIEDGTVVTDANSLATDEEFKTYANLRCMTVPATQPAREALLILAMDYIFSVEHKLSGCRTSELQELPEPRIGACVNYREIDSDEIPLYAKRAQMELALQAQTSPLLVNASIQNIAKEKLGDLEVEYFNGGTWSQVQTGRADAFLNPLYVNGGSSNIMERV
jgi:hypothetical protein